MAVRATCNLQVKNTKYSLHITQSKYERQLLVDMLKFIDSYSAVDRSLGRTILAEVAMMYWRALNDAHLASGRITQASRGNKVTINLDQMKF
jgi:hypothetical protein